jgi:uncharacterized protein (DUF427 family)
VHRLNRIGSLFQATFAELVFLGAAYRTWLKKNLKASWKGTCAMATARWNGVVLAESDHCHMVDGNYYFPPDSVKREYLKPSRAHSLCFWKGLASYYHIEVDGVRIHNAAWYYPAPTWLAKRIKNYVAF